MTHYTMYGTAHDGNDVSDQQPRVSERAPDGDADITTIFFVSDTHYGTETEAWNVSVYGPGTARQIVALNTLAGTAHPLGGRIKHPAAVIHIGDCVHEDNEPIARFLADYKLDGTGSVRYPCYLMHGNHDNTEIENEIVARHGRGCWSATFDDRVFFQAVNPDRQYATGQNYCPSRAVIEGEATTSFNQRPAGVPTFLLVHRALTGSYYDEWDNDLDSPTALQALEVLAGNDDVLGIIHGHNHYSAHTTIDGFRVFSPGAVHQTGGTLYAETIMVLRIGRDRWGNNWYDMANYIFGFDVTHNWVPGTWEWYERVLF